MFTLTKKTARFTLEMTIIRMGTDLCVSLCGGDSPHIGAVALAVPHPGLRNRDKTDATVSLLAVTGHKEGDLSSSIAYRLATALNCTASVSCGIHLEDATKDEITEILQASEEILEEVLTTPI